MDEVIGLKGILEGVRDMLILPVLKIPEKGSTDAATDKLKDSQYGILATRVECAKSMLDGVIKELEPPKAPPYPLPDLRPGEIKDPVVEQAKEELK